MDNVQDTSLVINEHDFQDAKNALKNYTERAKEEIEISSVRTRGGFLNLGDHTVKGHELNEITSQIQNYLVDQKEFNQGIVDELGQVYKALESLDKDYISGIVGSIQAAEKVSKEEKKDRADIKVLVQNLDVAVKALKKFKGDIEKIKHLMDFDATYELIEKQENLIKTLNEYKNELSKLDHIKDVDKMWISKEYQERALDNLKKENVNLIETLASQGQNISELTELLEQLRHEYQSFIDNTNKIWDEKQSSIDQQIDNHKKSMQRELNVLRDSLRNSQDSQSEKIDELFKLQNDKLFSIEKAQSDKLVKIAAEQSTAIAIMKKEQSDFFFEISDEQNKKFELFSKDQVEQLESINESLEIEKTSLKENVSILSQKIKTAYIVAGGAAIFAIIQMILNILGII